MRFQQLEYFLAVALEKNFSKAAEKLYITQPSLSHCIQRLEQQLETQLFDRTKTPVSLTPAGEVYLQFAKSVLEMQRQTKKRLQEISDFQEGRLTVGISLSESGILLPLILPEFHKRYPKIEIIPVEGSHYQLEKLAFSGTADLIFTTPPLSSPDFVSKPLFEESILLLVPRNHALCRFACENPPWPKVSLADLQNETFVLLNQGRRLRRIVDQYFLESDFKPKAILEYQSPEMIYNLVRSRVGITIGPDRFRHFGIDSNQLAYFALDKQLPKRTYSIVYSKNRKLPEAAIYFISLVKEHFASNDIATD